MELDLELAAWTLHVGRSVGAWRVGVGRHLRLGPYIIIKAITLVHIKIPHLHIHLIDSQSRHIICHITHHINKQLTTTHNCTKVDFTRVRAQRERTQLTR